MANVAVAINYRLPTRDTFVPKDQNVMEFHVDRNIEFADYFHPGLLADAICDLGESDFEYYLNETNLIC